MQWSINIKDALIPGSEETLCRCVFVFTCDGYVVAVAVTEIGVDCHIKQIDCDRTNCNGERLHKIAFPLRTTSN